MALDEARRVLAAAGFMERGEGLVYALEGRWDIRARAIARRGALEHVDIGLVRDGGEQMYGTVHRAFSLQALRTSIPTIVERLVTLASSEALLTCPVCKQGFVILREPPPGGTYFPPFLSCEGADPRTRAPCHGVSHRLPPWLPYR